MSETQDPSDNQYPSAGYAWYVVGVLTVAYIFSFIDRQIISLMVAPIKADLQISDTQMSLLMGLSFAIFYTLFGIPLGWLADRASRRALISWGVAFWSLMTAGCGLSRNFVQLGLMRMGVGVGEAALSPAAYSLIADYFAPKRRSTAMSVYTMGIYVGSGLALIMGGQIVQMAARADSYTLPLLGTLRSWQIVFIAVGLPGLLVALLLLTVKEPMRHRISTSGTTTTLKETWSFIWNNSATLFALMIGVALVTLSSYANMSWMPQLFVRKFEWSMGQIGLVYGLIVGVCGILGVVGGGWLADRWLQQGREDAPVRVALLGCLIALPCSVIYPLAGSGNQLAYFLIPMVFASSIPFGVAPAAIQRMMPPAMRAQATAVYLFVINIIGMGLGPTLPALLTDKYFKDPLSLNYSLLIVGSLTYLAAIICLLICLKNYRHSLTKLTAWTKLHQPTDQ